MQFRDFFQQYTTGILFTLAGAKATNAQNEPLDFFNACGDFATRCKAITEAGAKIMIVGNGGSAAIASHQSFDWWKNGKLRTMAFNDSSLLTGGANDFGYPDVFSQPIQMFGKKEDIVIAISSSGQSANIVNAAKKAREMGCFTMTLSAFKPDNPLRSAGDLNIYLETMEYGHAELGHETILHTILDWHIGRRDGKIL
ncbi:MAG: SIS domain-containing protein [Patescibacteria group bacterium]|jgi:D-sedoheptulose 7-phosphate isomerase